MNVFLWHVHGSWTTAFVHGGHRYFVPVLPDRGPEGRGRADTFAWPANVFEVSPEEASTLPIDVVLLQRPEELHLWAEKWLGQRRPGRDVPALYVEHNAPQGRINDMRHPAADRPELIVVHVTHFNDLFWDCGTTPTRVIEHGIVDPGLQYSGELPRIGVVINEPLRRHRVTGTDLLPRFDAVAPVDLFGMQVAPLGGYENLPQSRMHQELARRRVYVHPMRWTSLGLSLLEAMQLGMPVVALAATEAVEAVPKDAGVVSTQVDVLVEAVRRLVCAPDEARSMGQRAREFALARYGLGRFLAEWDQVLGEVAR